MQSAFNILNAVLPLIAVIGLIIGIRLCARTFFAKRRPPPAGERCKCGYPLEGLSVPRCPECGRVVGFDATPEQLGLTDEHLKRAQAARVRRKEKDASQAPMSDDH